jgi:SAM-dependent methyltransferase
VSDQGNFGERQRADRPDWGFFAHLSIYRFAAPLVAGKRCLEIGCGTGYGSAHLLEAGPERLVAMDKAADVLETLRVRLPTIEFVARDLDVEGIGLPAETFDFAFSSNVFEHLAYPDAVLEDLVSVLSPDACLFLAVPPVTTPGMLAENAKNLYHINNIPPCAWVAKLSRFFHEVKLFRHWVVPGKTDATGEIIREDPSPDDFVFTEESTPDFSTITSVFQAVRPRESVLPADPQAESCPESWRPRKVEADARQEMYSSLLGHLEEIRTWAESNRASNVDPQTIITAMCRQLAFITGGEAAPGAAETRPG